MGLSILRAATLEGWNCALVEAESDLLSHASGSNSGIACTGVDASPGTLERALIRDSVSQLRMFCKSMGVPMRPCGSLVCSWPWDDSDAENLDNVLEESHSAGDTHASMLSSSQVRLLEPNLYSGCTSAVHIPGEIVLDPWLYSTALAAHARENGADIFTNFKFDPDSSNFENGLWKVVEKSAPMNSSAARTIKAKAVVNAAGLSADEVQSRVLGASPWVAKPRRGQYRLYRANKGTKVIHPIQPIPTQRTKGIFIFSTVYKNILVVGPTALDQNSKTDRSVDSLVAKELECHLKRVLPGVDVESDYVADYVGIRPGSDKRDYQIHAYPRRNWVAVAAIRSTGLTASLGIGSYVVRQLQMMLDAPISKQETKTTPLPSVPNMIREFRDSGGYVTIGGNRYRVTHPLTAFSWQVANSVATSSL